MMRLHERSAADRPLPAYVPPRAVGPSPVAIVLLVVVHVFALIGVVATVAAVGAMLP